MPHQAELPPDESIAGHAGPANDPNVINLPQPALDFDDEPPPARAPLRFGRLALWMASASALGIGVLGTVAYSMWFNHDQRVYAEAMAGARKTLGIDQPVIAARTQSAGVVETPTTSAPVYAGTYASSDGPTPLDTASLANNAPTSDATDEGTVADSSDGSDASALATATVAAASARAGQSAQAAQAADGPQAAPPAQTAAQHRANGSATQQAAASRGNQAAQARRRVARAKPEGGLFARVGAFFHRVSYRHNVPNRQREEYSRP
ncbi:hypothetical protein [Caballeronia ptereochthonis]|uniref:Uncharacterized protein n=1 Tax=Caballeronia ptereochthonis TaxID=1777144 RepID=A0A158AA15_9BURK|nr:hypothetical protein [Caballeronia ptereochthonis]SAK54682.1 hypothetical protein AWB83_01544 [Caballeronia ptereochthonis]